MRGRQDPLPDFNAYCETACVKLWGEPDKRTKKELRWNGGDAYSVRTFNVKQQAWYDHGQKRGGSTLDLVAYTEGKPKEKLRGAAFFEAWQYAFDHAWVLDAPTEKKKAKGGKAGVRATYPYHDETGTLLSEVVRFDTADKDERFRYRRPDGKGGWIWDLEGVRRVLYRLPQLIATVKAGQRVLVCEGERDAESAVRLGYAGTTAPGGVGKWDRDGYDECLRGADAVVVSDNDANGKGQAHAAAVAARLSKVAARVRVIIFPQKDLTEWVEAGGTHEQLDALIEAAPDHCPPQERATTDSADAPTPTQQITLLPPPSNPMAVAREFVKRCCLYNGSAVELMLRHWCGSWWSWQTTHWIEVDERVVQARLYAFTEHAIYFDSDMKPVSWQPNRRKIGDVLEALAAIVLLSNTIEQPCWLDGRESGPIVAVVNGLLDIATRQLYAHTPLYFGQVSVPFDYDEAAPSPDKWLTFLDELWPMEAEAIDTLHEWFGYVVSGRLDLHKILVMIGPTRAGKGIIARILTALIGKRSVCGPTLTSLGGEFGLAPLLGKSLAVISDARFGTGKNSSVVVERLLSISGEDTLTVNRKYREQWNGKLPVRLHVISNELPRLPDASGAITGRMVVLPLTRSWLGKENYGLESELRGELPGILNQALEGLRRLTFDNQNRFMRVPSADDAVRMINDLASPVSAFVRERCKVGPSFEVGVDVLYDEHKKWCEANEYPKCSKHVFGRDLRAAHPSVKRTRPRDGKNRRYVYEGIALRPPGEEEPDEQTQKTIKRLLGLLGPLRPGGPGWS